MKRGRGSGETGCGIVLDEGSEPTLAGKVVVGAGKAGLAGFEREGAEVATGGESLEEHGRGVRSNPSDLGSVSSSSAQPGAGGFDDGTPLVDGPDFELPDLARAIGFRGAARVSHRPIQSSGCACDNGRNRFNAKEGSCHSKCLQGPPSMMRPFSSFGG